jgi:predicted DNA binding CopG/RHH family protein
VPAIGGNENRYMKKKIKYSNEKMGEVEIVKDFLPKPGELVFKEDTVKVTLNLSKSSIEFFKEIAQKQGSQYQKIIRNLLDRYTSHSPNSL